MPQPLVVRVADANGQLLANIAVEFRVVEGGGHPREIQTQTDASGIARGYWVLGTDVAQSQQLDAVVLGSSGQLTARFTATGRPGSASRLVPLAGDAQTGRLGEVLPESLAVKVADQYGNGSKDIAVTWTVNGASGGTIAAGSAVSDTNGVVKAAWVLGARLDVTHIATVTAEALTTTFTANATIPSTARLEILGGDAQRAPVGTALAELLAVRLTLASGAPVQGAGITWLVTGDRGFAGCRSDASGACRHCCAEPRLAHASRFRRMAHGPTRGADDEPHDRRVHGRRHAGGEGGARPR